MSSGPGARDDPIRDSGVRQKYVIEKNPDPSTQDSRFWEKKPGVTSRIKDALLKKPRPDSSLAAFWKVTQSCSKLDVWPFVVGLPALGTAAGLSGAFINFQFRKNLYLGHHGRITSFLALGVVPISTCLLLHGALVTTNMLKRPNECAICQQVRGGLIQVGIGVVYPLILAPLLALPISKRLAKYSVPKLSRQNLPVLLAYVRDLVSPLRSKFLGLAAMNLILGMAITTAEQYSYHKHIRPELVRQAEAAGDPSDPSRPVRTRETGSVIVH